MEEHRDPENISPSDISPPPKSSADYSDSMLALNEAVNASLNSAFTPEVFIEALFYSLKASSPPPKKSIPTSLTYGDLEYTYGDLEYSNDKADIGDLAPPPRKVISASFTYTDLDLDENNSDSTPSLTESDIEEHPEESEKEMDTPCDETPAILDAPLVTSAPIDSTDVGVEEALDVGMDGDQQEKKIRLILKKMIRLKKDQTNTKEYVIPADESEWTKLFDVVRSRLLTTELSEYEKFEGEGLLLYQDHLSYLPLTELASIFEQFCLFTNTVIETANLNATVLTNLF